MGNQCWQQAGEFLISVVTDSEGLLALKPMAEDCMLATRPLKTDYEQATLHDYTNTRII